MLDLHAELNATVAPEKILGYMNFSSGGEDPKFLSALNLAFGRLWELKIPKPWLIVQTWLTDSLQDLTAAGSTAFQDPAQVVRVLEIVFGDFLTEYRKHHRDLLAFQPDDTMLNAFFIGRIIEAVLGSIGSSDQDSEVISRAIKRLNDYVGHRPIAILEKRPQTDFYPHEKVRPVPLYIANVGSVAGKYQQVIDWMIRTLQNTPSHLLDLAWFDFRQFRELSFDPRAYDHGHPVNRRPNYLFGEWDPHQIDTKGLYHRFVIRQNVLDALLSRTELSLQRATTAADREGIFQEAGAVLAGTILMASGICGAGPNTHTSDAKLTNLIPDVARNRDAFYTMLLERLPGKHGERLRQEAIERKQPFAGIRQHLNQELALQRALQLQNHELSMILAEMGATTSSQRYAEAISVTSTRLVSEIAIKQSEISQNIDQGQTSQAAIGLKATEEIIRRAIECGAMADPWNILGYQGLFPLFQTREDSAYDNRNDELIHILTNQFDLYTRAIATAAALKKPKGLKKLENQVKALAEWWDQFAAYEVSDIPRLHGGERATAAIHVARCLADWNEHRDEYLNDPKQDIQFWKSRHKGFTSAPAFAQVVESLILQQNWRASRALLIAWLCETPKIPLEEGNASWNELSTRWIDGVLTTDKAGEYILTFFEWLSANADDYWGIPQLPVDEKPESKTKSTEAAFEGMTYQDSTDDGNDSSLAGDSGPKGYFSLDEYAPRLEKHLAFLSNVAVLWRKAASHFPMENASSQTNRWTGGPHSWLSTANAWHQELVDWTEQLHGIELPSPVGGIEEIIEYDQRRVIKDDLTELAINASVELERASWAIATLIGKEGLPESTETSSWSFLAGAIDMALAHNDLAQIRATLPQLMNLLGEEQLLIVPLGEGGSPNAIRKIRTNIVLMESLLDRLAKAGLLRETYHLLRLAKAMEANGYSTGRRVSDFDRLFRIALSSVIETLYHLHQQYPQVKETRFVSMTKMIAESFSTLWLQHSRTLRLTPVEPLLPRQEWRPYVAFIKNYGKELFTALFMTYANIRGILHRGVEQWLDNAEQLPPSEIPHTLLDALHNQSISRSQVINFLEITLHAIAEHYEEYRDYNTTTTWSDYGDNLYVVIDFLRLKAEYERHAWQLKPAFLIHEQLCKLGATRLAKDWSDSLADGQQEIAENLLHRLSELEKEHSVRLRTIRDRFEERFLKPLTLDRLCSQVLPAMKRLKENPAVGDLAFREFNQDLEIMTDTPSGVGLDVPLWIRKLRDEVERASELLTRPAPPRPAIRLTVAELEQQFQHWDEPISNTV
ncbi:MAG: hypothetical protein R3B84_04345 [Zavarzinella sp.]